MQISTVRPSIVCLKKKLIILDLNGLLVDIVSPPPKYRKPDAMVGKKASEKQLCYSTFLYYEVVPYAFFTNGVVFHFSVQETFLS